MKLAYWMYAGPAHIGTLRVGSSFKNVSSIMHAPLGDDYFNVMRSMLERSRDFTPVTASIVDRHVLARGSQEKVIENIVRKDKEEHPDLILLTPTCTSSILQEDLQNFADRAALESQSDVILADVNHYRVNEHQAADRTLEQVIRFYLNKSREGQTKSSAPRKTKKPSANILGIFTLGFHHTHDTRELKRLLMELGIDTHCVIPEGGSVTDLQKLPEAWFNIVPYREGGLLSAQYLEREYGMPFTSTTPMGVFETSSFIREIQDILNTATATGLLEPDAKLDATQKYNFDAYVDRQNRFVNQSAWFSRSVDAQNLTGKKTVVFGDATHAAAMTKILAREMGIRVCCAGCYTKNDADWFRDQVSGYCDAVLITDDHTVVGDTIARIEPAAIFGTQMERHIGKKLGIPCSVISTPTHVQSYTLGYRPFLGYEGCNQICDMVYNTFQLGMEEHLLEIFGGHDTAKSGSDIAGTATESQQHQSIPEGSLGIAQSASNELRWAAEALAELERIPGFVRGKIKRRVEKYATQMNISTIQSATMYAAKEANIE